MERQWKNRYKQYISLEIACSDCIDFKTCRKDERTGGSGCENYLSAAENVKKTIKEYSMNWIVEKTGVTRQTVYNYIRKGLIKPVRYMGHLSFSEGFVKAILNLRNSGEVKKEKNLRQFKK